MKSEAKSSEAIAKRGRKRVWRFMSVFLGVTASYYGLTLWPWFDANALFPVMKATAHGTSALLQIIGVNTLTEGVLVRGPHYAVAVRRGCDPLEPIVMFAAGAIAFPAAWRQRLAGLVIAGTLLFGLNLVRVASLYLLGSNGSSLFESVHLVWWPAIFVLCSLALWVLWLLWLERSAADSKATGPAKPRLREREA